MLCSVFLGVRLLRRTLGAEADDRFYTTYRLLPVVKESVIVVASPGWGAFYDETDPGFDKHQNRKKMGPIRQGRRDALFLDAVFKVFIPPPHPCAPLSVFCFSHKPYVILLVGNRWLSPSYHLFPLTTGILHPKPKYHIPSHLPRPDQNKRPRKSRLPPYPRDIEPHFREIHRHRR